VHPEGIRGRVVVPSDQSHVRGVGTFVWLYKPPLLEDAVAPCGKWGAVSEQGQGRVRSDVEVCEVGLGSRESKGPDWRVKIHKESHHFSLYF
jgi:hypothetical protein